MRSFFVTAFLTAGVALTSGCASPGGPGEPSLPTPPDPGGRGTGADFGVLVMAHGGSDAWNEQVADAVAPLAEEVPTRLAYGMADPHTLRAALDSLREDGVSRVAVVRMFLSGRSFLEQTRYFLGMSATPPAEFVLMSHGAHGAPGHAGTSGTPAPVGHGLTVATHNQGMLDSPEAGRILRERARELGRTPGSESVLLLAHGMGDPAENAEVLTRMDAVATAIESDGFAHAFGATLREDWAEERADAEREIRDFVQQESARGRRVLVVPARLSGFGPYAEVLAGLAYEPGEGLLPHPDVTEWLRATAYGIACANGWVTVGVRCGTVAEERAGGTH